jgi:hypothetical protein
MPAIIQNIEFSFQSATNSLPAGASVRQAAAIYFLCGRVFRTLYTLASFHCWVVGLVDEYMAQQH